MVSSKIAGTSRVSWWAAALMLRGQTEADQRNISNFTAWCFVWAFAFCAVAIVPMAFGWAIGSLLVAARYR